MWVLLYGSPKPDGSSGNGLLIWIPIAVAILTGLLVPIVLRWWDKYTKQKVQQDMKQEQTIKELSEAGKQLLEERFKASKTKLEELEANLATQIGTLTDLRDRLGKLDRDLLKRFGECQGHFVTTEAYKKDLGIQRYYYKIIYSMLQKQMHMVDGTVRFPNAMFEEDEEE